MMLNAGGNMPAINQGNFRVLNRARPLFEDSIERSPQHHCPITVANLDNNTSDINTSHNNASGGVDSTKTSTSNRLQDLVKEINPIIELDEEVEEILLQLADDFIDNCLESTCRLAKHRRSSTVELKDINLHLGLTWNMSIPGFGKDEDKPYKHSEMTEAHKQKLALIKKKLKKY